MKIRLLIEAEPIQRFHSSGKAVSWILLSHSDLELKSEELSKFVTAIQKSINKFTAHVNQNQNTEKAL